MRKMWVALLAMLAVTTLSPILAAAADSGPNPAAAASLLAIGKDDRILGKSGCPDYHRRICVADLSALRPLHQ